MTLKEYARQLAPDSIGEWNRMTVAERKREVASHNAWLKKQAKAVKAAQKRATKAAKAVAKQAAAPPRKTRVDQSSFTPAAQWADWFSR